ncbi:Predicted nuclease (RNAse H fold) [Aureimonas altamirensis DSM 21988]|uniref:Predicted nuclease (RNAse H fold) n=1 Tax=Aureimonas altamirensis DSM 21988 TaxID=1121026 RepID=A0ABY1I595_9HYPH|nr:DUF429 domain-containing protein [Aureimonas altamirensis]SHI50493.1 Predicted nuclease (RNAse H fold) [Aureimonas altamirensis DSM 21988]
MRLAGVVTERRTVLGIDAAWTDRNPSGVALVECQPNSRRLLAVFGSYSEMIAVAGSDSDHIEACISIGGQIPSVVAVDMPLSHDVIRSRRVSDNAVSALWGSRYCATHTPNELRPGEVGRRLHAALAARGFTLATEAITERSLIEVYPHPAIVELTGARQRLPYKVGKARKYWPEATLSERRCRLAETWQHIIRYLDDQVAGVQELLPLPMPEATTFGLKSFEDKLDAVVCAWVGCLALEGKATPYGDSRSAIWLPTPPSLGQRHVQSLFTD